MVLGPSFFFFFFFFFFSLCLTFYRNCGPVVTEKFSFPEGEKKTLAYWDEIDAFKTSLKLSEGRPRYTFYDGPPFATGLPHYGHLLAGSIKV